MKKGIPITHTSYMKKVNFRYVIAQFYDDRFDKLLTEEDLINSYKGYKKVLKDKYDYQWEVWDTNAEKANIQQKLEKLKDQEYMLKYEMSELENRLKSFD
ncbi:hypothetical protein PQ478_09070 [Alkalihalophilus pseudofirmus]|uniref:hypothetical protein n=1 Tax=Alkalihalophilus pseudofirmus TaxID=79885 RepID=UPI00259B1CAA|nr:hypothetical protein [Alkalihalophilus pseudofirmus]WEG18622.1 hypothetical protein PQ478_09070 [Alkalihalophilus pseudofirmus]